MENGQEELFMVRGMVPKIKLHLALTLSWVRPEFRKSPNSHMDWPPSQLHQDSGIVELHHSMYWLSISAMNAAVGLQRLSVIVILTITKS